MVAVSFGIAAALSVLFAGWAGGINLYQRGCDQGPLYGLAVGVGWAVAGVVYLFNYIGAHY